MCPAQESWGWDESIPDCMAAKLNVTINQQLVTTDQVKPVIYGKVRARLMRKG